MIAQPKSNITTRLLDLFERSIIVQSIITLGLIGTLMYLWLSNLPVPDDLVSLGMLVMGYWFGSKVQNEIAHVERMRKE